MAGKCWVDIERGGNAPRRAELTAEVSLKGALTDAKLSLSRQL